MTTADLLLQAEQAIWRILQEIERGITKETIKELERVRAAIALHRSGE
jgi:hypothetical protein